ncbi:MAG: YiiX/YebB-like N1pC/P60 family cysteine hydrolase [Fusobacteriota bacterium]
MKKVLFIFMLILFFGCTSTSKKGDVWQDPKLLPKNKSKLQVGDIIIKRKGDRFLELFGHSGIVTENNLVAEVPKMGVGFIYTSLSHWENSPRDIMVFRLKDVSQEFKDILLSEIEKAHDKPYRIVFNKKSDHGYYCSQFVWNVYYKTSLNFKKEIDLNSDGGLFVFPYDMIDSKYLEQIFLEKD